VHEKLWASLVRLRPHVADHFKVLGLLVEVDEAEGYAFLRSRPVAEGEEEFPRLIARRSLPFHVSLLLALLRKRLAEFDASNADARLTMTRQEIVDLLGLYMPESTNEAKLTDSISAHTNRVVEMGFLRRMQGQDDLLEVCRIIKAFVDGQWLAEFDARLDEYAQELTGRGAGDTRGQVPE